MSIKDALNHEDDIQAAGITDDIDFADKTLREFTQKYPNFDIHDYNSPGWVELSRIEDERYFRADFAAPTNLQDAISFVRKVCFFPPLRVWIDDKEYDVHEYHSDDFVRIPDNNHGGKYN